MRRPFRHWCGRLAAGVALVSGASAWAETPAGGDIPTPSARERLIALVAQMQELQARVEAGDPAAVALFEAYDMAARQALAALDPGDLPQAAREAAATTNELKGLEGGVAAAFEGAIAGGSPPAPPGCTQYAEIGVSNTTDVVIPATADTPVTSALVITGARPWLFNVLPIVNITHGSCHELDITLTSPAGTIVTLTTDNGNGSNFTVTGFLDNSNPGGQVPYASNAGLASDRTYGNNVNAGLLVPEEGLAAFQGEDANGVWVLTINDDAVGAGGTLTGWSLTIDATDPPGFAHSATFSIDPTLAIPTGPSLVSSSINAAGLAGYTCDVDVFVDIDHTATADLDFTVQAPNGHVVTLSTDNGGTFDNNFAGTIFDAQADRNGVLPYTSDAGLTSDQFYFNGVTVLRCAPEESLGALLTSNPNGLWTLTISDDAAANGGTLNSWAVTITTCACTAPCPGDVNNDGAVDINDYTLIVLNWGGC